MSTTRLVVARILSVLGIVLIVASLGVCIGSLFGLLRSFPDARFVFTIVFVAGIAIRWLGISLAAGTLKREVKDFVEYERRESLRLRSSLGRRATVLVVIASTILAGLICWLVLLCVIAD